MQHFIHGFHYAASHEVPAMKTQGWMEYVKPVDMCKEFACDEKDDEIEVVETVKPRRGRPPKAR